MRLLFLAAVAAAVSFGCTTTGKLADLGPEEQAKVKGTEPGRHALSPFFVVEIKSNALATFYYIPDPQDSKTRKPIGKQRVNWEGLADGVDWKVGPRENAYAVSADGRSLLYFVDPEPFLLGDDYQNWGNSFHAELHLYRHGSGDSLIAKGIRHWVTSRSPVPADAVIYAEVDRSKPYSNVPAMQVAGETLVKSIGELVPR